MPEPLGASLPEALGASSPAGPLPTTFRLWLDTLPKDKLQKLTQDYGSYRDAEDEWRAGLPKAASRAVAPKAKRTASKVNYKIAVGKAYRDWLAGAGATSKAPLKDCGRQS